MIRPIDIRLNAAHPELPLAEAVTYTGSPSTVLIRGVPPNCGRWAITAVFVAASFPDGSTTTRAAVQSANGVWVATLPATATSGRTANGVRVMADGIDENGDAVTGYILGVADFAVASLDVTPAPEPGETSWQMLYFDTVPGTLRKGDVATIDGVPKFYNGTAWKPFAAPVTFDNAVTRTSTNGVKSSGIWSALWGALAALPTGFTSLYGWCKSYVDAKSSIKSPDGDTVVSAGNDGTAKVSHTEHILQNPVVNFPDGFSIGYGSMVYTSPAGGETVEFVGPVPSANPNMPNTTFYYPASLGSLESFDPNNYSVWCLTCFNGGLVPDYLVYATGPDFRIVGFNSESPTLTLFDGEMTGDPPTMTRAEGTSTITKTAATVDQIPAVVVPSTSTSDSGKAADAKATGDALNGKLDKSGGEMTGALSTPQVNITREGYPTWSMELDSEVGRFHFKAPPLAGVLGSVDLVLPRRTDNISGTLALAASNPTAGNLAALDANGNPTDSTIPAANVAVKGEIPYILVTKTITNGTVTLDNRAINAVAASSSLASLTVNFPTATSGKVRDFGLRLTVASGITTAPQLVLPQGVTCENADGTAPEIGADGAATILYFTETASGVFLVKGEVVTAIS